MASRANRSKSVNRGAELAAITRDLLERPAASAAARKTRTPIARNVMAITSRDSSRVPAWKHGGGPEGNGSNPEPALSRPLFGGTMNVSPSGNDPPFLTFLAVLVLVWLAASAIALSLSHLF
jgi:hypothetical protein